MELSAETKAKATAQGILEVSTVLPVATSRGPGSVDIVLRTDRWGATAGRGKGTQNRVGLFDLRASGERIEVSGA